MTAIMKLKQKIMSKKLGISETLLSRILSGERNITYELAKKLNILSRVEVLFWMEASGSEIREELSRLKIKEAA
jgi:transcriptional regulator with XRE-family HTH domain